MNKKIIVALICISIIGVSAIPAMGLNDSKYNNEEAKLTAHRTDPVNITLNVTIKRGLSRGIYVNIDNVGDENASQVNYSITLSKSNILGRVIATGCGNLSLDKGLNETVSIMPFRIGRIVVTANVTAPGEDPIEVTAKGLMLGKFVFLFKSR